ncbi:hypothetical protein J6590_011178 [Homalodisca vitripennis]|nr:hypothetical protein J6590_011178 [Homalodisca vitripennis]
MDRGRSMNIAPLPNGADTAGLPRGSVLGQHFLGKTTIFMNQETVPNESGIGWVSEMV